MSNFVYTWMKVGKPCGECGYSDENGCPLKPIKCLHYGGYYINHDWSDDGCKPLTTQEEIEQAENQCEIYN